MLTHPHLARIRRPFGLAALVIAVTSPITLAAQPIRTHVMSTATDSTWRPRVRAFAAAHLQHTAWGTAHAERDYRTALAIARASGMTVDDDALYAAAYLHDMGAFPEFAEAGVDHGDRAGALVGDVLREAGFPEGKIALVREIVTRHMYYHPVGQSPEAICFRDADTLDFLGALGVARILSLTTRHRWAPDLPSAVETIRRNLRELPPTLTTEAARKMAVDRVTAMQKFLEALNGESGGTL